MHGFIGVLIVLALGTPSAFAYLRYAPNGAPLMRTDFSNIRFKVNESVAPGLTNADGNVFITADSDPVSALKAAMAAWSSIPNSTVKFAPLESTAAVNDPADGMNVIVFRDTPEIRSVLGSALALNLYSILPDGAITETDILFNPTKTYSTTLAPGTFDIQSLAAHELGHSLGANHTGILSAAMFHATQPGESSQRILSADDALFASTVYPAPGPSGFGTIAGRLTASDGSPFRGGLITAIESATGNAAGGLSSLVDGSYSIQIPAGDYFVSAEPLGGAVQPANLYLTTAQVVDTVLQPGFVGGIDTPAIVSVPAGGAANGDIAVAAGASAIKIQFTAIGAAGGAGDVPLLSTGPQTLRSGQSSDLLFTGAGLDGSLTGMNVRIIGPGVTLRPDSVHLEPGASVDGRPIVRITLDVAARLSTGSATLVVTKDGNTALFSGGLIRPLRRTNIRKVSNRILLIFCLGVALVPSATAYVRLATSGAALRRTDAANIQFLLNSSAKPGLVNSQGQPFITGDSDPAGAIRAALATWSSIPSAAVRFAPLGGTSAANNPNDNLNVFVFQDTPEIRNLVGDAVAKTVHFLRPDGQIVETDIVFSPARTFSTNQADGTYDIQSVVTHELGHALGADHTGVLGATMYQNTFPGQTNQRRLSADDIAFASSVYPPPGGNGYGTISGRLAAAAGGPLRGGFVTAVDASTGVVIDGLSGSTDGAYSFQVPPGNYLVYAEPLVGEVKPANLFSTMLAFDTGFEPAFYSGAGGPAVLPVGAGAVVTANLTAPPGPSPIQVQFTAVLPVGQGGTIRLLPGPRIVASGQSVDLLLFGSGIDGSLTDANIRIAGQATVRAGSVKLDSAAVNGAPVVRLTLDVPARSSAAIASIVITKGADTGVLTGGLVLTPPKPVFTAASTANGASFLGGDIAPGEIVTIFGTNLGPTEGVQNAGFDASGALPTNLGDVSVAFGGVLAPLFYVSSGQINVQVPYEAANSSSSVIRVLAAGAESDPTTVPIVPASPGIFQIPGTDRAIVVNQDGSLNSPGSPAPRGSVVTIYATGTGVVSPPLESGKPAAAAPLSTANVTAAMGGVPATVSFGGMAPGFVGLLQVNAEVPTGITPGAAIPLRISVAGASSQTNAIIAVR